MAAQDSISTLEVTVSAFESGRSLLKTAGAVSYLTPAELLRYDNSSILPALNTVPGVKMESRGPGGSRRISIRGSMLRSPFGVRNIKVYWNDIPLSSPDGSTPLELIDVENIGGMEVLRGPAGSLYGAGNGGVLLFKSDKADRQGAYVGLSTVAGDYGFRRLVGTASVATDDLNLKASYIQHNYDGYREQEFFPFLRSLMFVPYHPGLSRQLTFGARQRNADIPCEDRCMSHVSWVRKRNMFLMP